MNGALSLPPPPEGCKGWPWEPVPMPAADQALDDMPRVTVVTPSFNQARFLERTLRSVLLQDYPSLEYIVIDGGSTDGSVDIIRRYGPWLAYWVSEKDHGQVEAINKGLQRASGEWVAWQNSDDIYYPGAIRAAAIAAAGRKRVDLVVGNIVLIDADDRVLRDVKYVQPTYRSILAEGMVLANQAAFWRRAVHDRAGYPDERLAYSFDREWFLRVLEHGRAVHVNQTWGGLRLHDASKSRLYGERFQRERQVYLAGRQPSRWVRAVYQMRRLALMLARGDFAYVMRGLAKRLMRRPDISG